MAGLYVHIPFCESRCYYCDFYSSTYLGNRDNLLSAISEELKLRKEYLHGEPVRTIYLGGGTPSLLTINELHSLFQSIFENYVCDPVEITMEANPEDLTDDYLHKLRTLPINRLSVGVQSFHDEELQLIHRRHTAQRAIDAIRRAQDVGFENISLDLIYGLPNQTMELWEDNLQQTINLNVPHVSAYSLTFEEHSMLTKMKQKGEIQEVDEEVSLQMFKRLRSVLSVHGILPYEISNFAKPGYESKHNSSYWNYVPYIGVGPSAHSFDGESRQWNTANSRLYIQQVQSQNNQCSSTFFEKEILDRNTRYNEYVMTSMRRREGVNVDNIREMFGMQLHDYFLKMIQPFCKANQVECSETCFYLSEEGIFISDYIIESLLWVD